jgi:hypothetical protein
MGRKKKSDIPVVPQKPSMLQATASIEDSGNARYWDEKLEALAKASLAWEYDISHITSINEHDENKELEYMFASMHRLKEKNIPIDIGNFITIFGKFEKCKKYLEEKRETIEEYNKTAEKI